MVGIPKRDTATITLEVGQWACIAGAVWGMAGEAMSRGQRSQCALFVRYVTELEQQMGDWDTENVTPTSKAFRNSIRAYLKGSKP